MAKTKEDLANFNGAELVSPIILNDQIIEPVVNLEISDASNEAFMNEMVEVTISSTGAENEEPHVVFNVNNRNQVFFMDVPTMCRRLFLEVIARCKKTKYVQRTDPYDMTRSEMVPTTSFVYPFSVVDQNPKGRAWLQAVKLEAN